MLQLTGTSHRSSFLTNLYCVTLITLFAIALSVEKGNDVLWINGHHSDFLDIFFQGATLLGDGIIFVPIVLATVFIRFELTLVSATAWIGHGLLVSLFKRILVVDAMRPKAYLNNELLHFIPGVDVHSAHSFPSGHTATAFCAAFLIALISRNKLSGVLALIVACLVGYSRIYLLQHFLLDVAAGAFIGCITASLVWILFDFRNKPRWMSRNLKLQKSFWRLPHARTPGTQA
jgi:membrane-associated phospholipid phosphatase